MSVFTYEIATDIVIPNITVVRQYQDGVHITYQLTPNDGYVMYDSTANNTEYLEDEDGNPVFDEEGNFIEVPVIYYYRFASVNARYAPSTWQNNWVAVLENSVDGDYIFGVGNNHEIM